MGRSISYLSGAQQVAYFECPRFIVDGETEEGYFDFAEMIEHVQCMLSEFFPSLDPCDRWEGNEDHVILENKIAQVAISEYCGGCSLSVAAIDGNPLGERFARSINFMDAVEKMFDVYQKVGSFSNGGGVFERRKK